MDLAAWLKQHAIEEVEVQVPDIAGTARGKFMPADKFLRQDGMRLPDSLFTQTITGEYAELEELEELELERDMTLQPDLNTIRPVPWANEPTAMVIQDCYDRGGAPIPLAPRQVLRRVLDLYAAKGWRPVVAPEVEFYLIERNDDPEKSINAPIGRSGRRETNRQAYSIDALNEFDPLFERLFDYCEAMDINADSLTHEAGTAQVEVNFDHGDPLSLADQVFIFKRAAREAAMRDGMAATFMAKPMAREPGSAMHLHHSVVDATTGQNLFANEAGEDSELFRHFIGGLKHYVPEALLLFAPYVNSYRRFTTYLAAPINLHWGRDNRTLGLRVPESDASNRRIENRIPGADVNPYLAVATSLACGYLGMIEGIDPGEPLDTNAYEEEPTVTRNMFEAMDRLTACQSVRDVLGKRFIDVYCEIKLVEHDTYFQVISPWEREFLLLNV